MKLLDQVRALIRKKHYSIRTEQAYVMWIKRVILFQGKRRPKELGEKEILQTISYLATEQEVSASTPSQALNAIVFLYNHVLRIELGNFGPMERSKRPERSPTVMSKTEVGRVSAAISGTYGPMTKLLYGCGLRSMECVRPRVRDIDFERNQSSGMEKE
ncbi:MAG: phage integrase N-terminal SAM-like domain-containing protein [Candidatus Latescibacteria bacterium]|nr:phage integrase N-terminal SAM-like domain-containing protein [Candidatus Latescibacterota bacterium]